MVTQKDIAKHLGISASLVSRALNGTAGNIGASAETVERIRIEAARLNYQPSAAALSLRGASTRTLGVVVKNFDDPFFGRLLEELESLASAQRYSLLLTGCPAASDIHSLTKYKLDGLFLAGTDFVPTGLLDYLKRGIRVVRIGCGGALPGVTRVVADIESGLATLVQHLMQLGHRDIGYISDDSDLGGRRERELLNVFQRHNLTARPACFIRAKFNGMDTGFDAMQLLLRQCATQRPTAVIAAEDVLAQGALRALFVNHVSVPLDLSLASVDDIPSAHMTIPALTTVRQPIPEMARQAFNLLLNSRTTPAEFVVQPELVIRESCAAPRESHR